MTAAIVIHGYVVRRKNNTCKGKYMRSTSVLLLTFFKYTHTGTIVGSKFSIEWGECANIIKYFFGVHDSGEA